MIELRELAEGVRLRIVGNVLAEVVQNMGDGEWLRVRLIEAAPGKGQVASEELCHATDIVEIL